MGDHSGWNQPGGAQPNGLRPGVVSSVTRVLDAERWAVAERRTAEIIARIQPSTLSEERRKAVTGYVQQLIANCFPCQVFTFGSVPLKTYLPDGDIDLSAFSEDLQLRDTWANKVRQVLENEEKRENAEFHVKEVQYIQAEVKIIKCLVENIVVDISFNQLGGLCTLCFLDEIDHLIDHNHLFKRSIILIKAWCYYESRILGAHHGLISTYALETLVLYIFHVFNNSFSGPLEVLYRFMEFFSNFDWENFCLSLWGPVPITSLPDTTADSPLKDSAELLLSKLFLKACSTVYAVFPATQENQGPPFVPKHFNIIDPLRTNNNLGRSVSRGNFYRIRSALGFGAERLAGLNDCSEDLIIAEVDNFFVNTWRRHGAHNRPDEPVLGMRALKLQVLDNNEEMKNKKKLPNTKSRTENVQLHANHECSGDEQMTFGRVSTQPSFPTKNSSQNMLVPSPQCQKIAAYQTSYEASEQPERSTDFSEKMAAQRFQKTSKPHSFARTHSSPDLSGSSSKFFSGGQRNKKPEGENRFKNERLTLHSYGRNLNAEVPADHVAVTSEDASSIRHSLSERNLGADIAHSNGFLHGYQGASRFPTLGGRLASASVGVDLHQKMCQDEQDMINMMALSNLHSFNEQVQQPIDASSCTRLPGSRVLLPNIYSQRPIGGIIPGNVPPLHPPSGSKLQFPQGFVSFNYFHNAGHQPNHEDKFVPKNDGFVVAEIEKKNSTQGYLWGQDAGTTSGFIPHKRVANSPRLSPDGKKLPLGEFNYDSVSQLGDSNGPSIRNQDKFARENTRLTWDVDNGAPSFPCTNELDTSSTERSAYIRCAPGSSSRSENVSESWDSTSTRSSKSGAGKNPRKPISSGGLTSSYNKTSSVWQCEDSSPDQLSMITDDEDRECVKLSARRTEITEPSILSPSLVTAHMQGHQVSGYSPVMMNGTDSGLTIPPVVYCNDFQRSVDDNSRMLPFTFIATGPPVPYLIYPRKPTDFDEAENQLSALDSGNINSSHRSVDFDERLSCADDVISLNSMDNSSEQPEQHTPDILNSDFASHWQNLQFGRFCHAQPQKPLVQASPMVVPQMHLQGNTPWSGPERPITTNTIAYPLVMNYEQRLIPTIPLQAGPRKPSGVYQSYREEVPRSRVGTGTFLPNHVPFRDRQNSGTRQYRGNYNYDRKEHGDREGTWVNSKSRYGGRNRVRAQFDRHSSRVSQLSTSDDRADNTWETHNQEKLAYCQTDTSSVSSVRSDHASTDTALAMYPLSSVSNDINSSGPVGPPLMMFYPYDPSAGYGSPNEQAEIGSVGPVHSTDVNVVSNPWDRSGAGSMFEKRHGKYQHSSSRSSPERQSSPEVP